MKNLFNEAIAAAKIHAREIYPEESCGYVADYKYVPVVNILKDPQDHDSLSENCQCRLCAFEMAPEDVANCMINGQMVIHSHPHGPIFPSKNDMIGQEQTGLPWAIIALDDDRMGDPEIWGGTWPVDPLLGRSFMHGIRDCYSLIKDTFALGAEQLKLQDVTAEWPFDPTYLVNYPRKNAWWNSEDDIYESEPFRYGFKEIIREEARPGDCFLTKIRSDKFNHAGVLISRDLILHHLPGRMSRREPAALWARSAGRWLRWTGEGQQIA